MILQALTQYYETLVSLGVVPSQGWCFANVMYGLNINREGKLISVIPLSVEVQRGKKKIKVAASIEVPERVVRSANVLPNFLCDNSRYLLGIDENGVTEAALKRFEASKKFHLEILSEINSDASKAIKNFFTLWDPLRVKDDEELKNSMQSTAGSFVFMLNERCILDDKDIRKAWDDYLESSDESPLGICLVTGKRDRLVRIHPKIKGVRGGQAGGSSLISYNEKAYESFEKEQSYNAPVGRYATFAYSTALNYILSQQDYKFFLGDTTIVYWTESGREEDQELFYQILTFAPDTLDMDRINELNGKIFILGIAPNAARLVIRFFYQNSVQTVLENIESHWRRMKLWKKDTSNGTLMKGFLNAEESGSAAGMLLAVLRNSNYPENLYRHMIDQIRVIQGRKKVTGDNVSVINAYLAKNKGWKFSSNNEEEQVENGKVIEKETPWILGKTFAILEGLQQEAITEINTSILDKYFNAACVTPERVFPTLMKLKNSHLRKLEEEDREYYKTLLFPLTQAVQVYPKRLNLEGQGMFISGYHYQKNILENREDK